MRIAICLSGQPRTWRWTRASLSAFFADHELDTYLHTWREGDPAELEAVVDAYAPRAARIEERPLFLEEKRQLAKRFPAGPPFPIFDMFHSIAASLELAAEAGENYDLVVRARFDALFDGVWSGEVPLERSLIIPDLYPYSFGCTDQFAMGSLADMQEYGEASVWLNQGAYPTFAEQWLKPERVLRHYLEAVCGLRVETRPIAMKLLRDGQVGRTFDEVSDDPLFHAAKHETWEAFAFEQFPELAARTDFAHVGRTALSLERALTTWLESKPTKDGFQLLKTPWPKRIQVVDGFISEQAGELKNIDEDRYRGVRLICAMLLQRMAPNEPMSLESWVVHALSANTVDMQRAHDWVLVNPDKLDRLPVLVRKLGPIAHALAFANPLEQKGIGAWRPR
jgi:hypothetical protein